MDVVANVTLDNNSILNYRMVAYGDITLNDNLILEPDITTNISTTAYVNEISNPGAIVYSGVT